MNEVQQGTKMRKKWIREKSQTAGSLKTGWLSSSAGWDGWDDSLAIARKQVSQRQFTRGEDRKIHSTWRRISLVVLLDESQECVDCEVAVQIAKKKVIRFSIEPTKW